LPEMELLLKQCYNLQRVEEVEPAQAILQVDVWLEKQR
jgi:hypothetical protein